MDYKQGNNGESSRGMTAEGCRNTHQAPLNTYDWLNDIPESGGEYVEVQFKNTRKGYYLNNFELKLRKGDKVVVESSPGYDLGMITLTGPLVASAMRRHRHDTQRMGPKSVLRLAEQSDLDKQKEAQRHEYDTMIRSRRIAEELGLEMKIGDVEYQGDGTKAIFYYIADGRVDFRQLIRVLADAFKVRIEMKQIGARQEAGRIGGIGSCGRPLCCSSWMNNFVSVGTTAARLQDLSLNPQKLTGQCAKLKCCLNHEVDVYAEAKRRLPHRDLTLETEEGTYYHFKTDVLKREISYSKQKNNPSDLITIPAERAFAILNQNKRGEIPKTLENDNKQKSAQQPSADILDDSLTRFDSAKRKRKRKRTDKPQDSSLGHNSSINLDTSKNDTQKSEQETSEVRSNGKPKSNKSFEPSKRVEADLPSQMRMADNRRGRNRRPVRKVGGEAIGAMSGSKPEQSAAVPSDSRYGQRN
ncbi:hypothetical protein HQ45_09465 [Porphyromonas crevioricanis]|uniref:PSP1 C-terminal domain-containing protein n=2 Tax=Porphyromonas crevioricanis TaxID=393921 RepID=A0AB34PIV6_9PORP|nr:regulatory iron-sulfur-containing complex subunit RicT [Porphyromonas crevioricanis]KGN88884.1 hypothetical protein HQ45_09465 [Porphyromonas crevioricanis]KGN95842.1 hypothetical protein HQ38_02405 [Porphyromonas crevioricanis]GAD04898.1 signal peptidase-like protein [Porphyromonas crevioricanis JCM 15906]SJZ73901.1 Cell fate regulator YaaT, PSP1 superfamily (controls sporulation, competence, biofilm development) [Porphyromonas crevioricanis]